MHLAKFVSPTGAVEFGCIQKDLVHPLASRDPEIQTLQDILESDDPSALLSSLCKSVTETIALDKVRLLPPIDQQEVWAAGVTYKRSKSARMEESEAAASCYDRVYEAERPEIFFKANPHRVVGPDQTIKVRKDSQWNVPEPELTVVINSKHKVVGYTVGNDVSSRDIEGENPLYLPQAKVYDGSCALGPWITLSSVIANPQSLAIALKVARGEATIYEGSTSTSQMARSVEDLVDWLGRENSFPNGTFLMTGTGIVPDSSFSLAPGDTVQIDIEHIGSLTNPVVST
ncbi:MAG: fumarylacetoacetate hydrolase family protein [Pirellulaceae bacterium]|nr:fumarylacetoacetate hydrolase family protein [Pirellulaceae bacterium]